MPYFVFRLAAGKEPALVASYDKYQDARDACRQLRKAESPANPNAVRMAHAANEREAKRLLTERRQPASPLEEWEA